MSVMTASLTGFCLSLRIAQLSVFGLDHSPTASLDLTN